LALPCADQCQPHFLLHFILHASNFLIGGMVDAVMAWGQKLRHDRRRGEASGTLFMPATAPSGQNYFLQKRKQ
jgi:hypothetical protein